MAYIFLGNPVKTELNHGNQAPKEMGESVSANEIFDVSWSKPFQRVAPCTICKCC